MNLLIESRAAVAPRSYNDVGVETVPFMTIHISRLALKLVSGSASLSHRQWAYKQCVY